MKITLTKEELRRRLRLLAGLEPARSDCAVEYTDGLAIDSLLDSRLRAWYLDLLATADMSLLAPSDISSTVRLTDGGSGGSAIALPAMCRRVAAVRLGGWTRATNVLPPTEAATVVRRQGNPFLAATADSPVAVELPGGDAGASGGILAWPPSDSVELLTAVLDPGPDSFIMDETALGGLEKLVEQINII